MSLHIARKIAEMKVADRPKTREAMLKLVNNPVWGPSRTKQSFKDSADINKMLKKAQTHGSIEHLKKYPEAVYGEFDGDFDLLTAQERIKRANEIFADAPSEVRREFGNNALAFVQWAGNPENNDKLRELLPALAKPGSYFPNPVQRGGAGAGAATPAPGSASSPPETPSDAGSSPAEGGTDG